MIQRFLSKLPFFNSALGEVVFETPPLKGQNWGSLFQWRLKQAGNGNGLFVGLKLKPDRFAGPEGSVTNYIELSIEAAEQAKVDLERCIGEYRRREAEALKS